MIDDKTSPEFIEIIKHILKLEGGYVCDPADRGGETNFGVSRRFANSVGMTELDIKNMTEYQAQKIYYNYFWKPIKGDSIIESGGKWVAAYVLDMHINSGKGVLILQKALNKFLSNKLVEDNLIGNKTLNALASVKDTQNLKCKLIESRIDYYIEITKRRPKNLKFLQGWTNRSFHWLSVGLS